MRVVLSLLTLCFSLSAFAQGKVIEGMYGRNAEMPTNYVINKGCYLNTRNITASGGSFTRNTTNALENGADCQVDASATAQTYAWATYSFDRVTSGQNCEAKLTYRGDGSLYKTYVQVNGVKVTQDLQLTALTVSAAQVSMVFPCGAQPLTTNVVIESTSASAAAINVANVYAGLATNLSNLSQASLYAGAEQAGASGCTYSQNTSSGLTNFVDLGTGTGCNAWTTAGAASVVGNNSHQLVLNNMPPGEYQFLLTGLVGTGAAQNCIFRMNDGTTTYQSNWWSPSAATGGMPLVFHANYSSGGNRTFRIQAADDGAGTCYWMSGSAGAGASAIASWKVYRFPSASELVQRNSTIYFPSYSATITAGATCTLATDVAQNGNWISGCSRTGAADFTLTFRSGLFAAAPHCSVTPRRALANTRYTVSSWIETISSSSVRVLWGANDDQGASITAAIALNDDSGTFHVQCTAREAASLPTPILVGSVTSNSTGAEYILRGTVSNNGSVCTYTSPGSWLSGTRGGTGVCSNTAAAGLFSSAPYCICSGSGGSNISCSMDQSAATATSLGNATTRNVASAGAVADASYNIICIGPR
jgi:hypothetical protein